MVVLVSIASFRRDKISFFGAQRLRLETFEESILPIIYKKIALEVIVILRLILVTNYIDDAFLISVIWLAS